MPLLRHCLLFIFSSKRKFHYGKSSISAQNKVRVLFVVDIRFYEQKTTPKQYMYNEIYCLIFERKKILNLIESSVFQLSEALQDGDNSHLCTKRTHMNMLKKCLYLFIWNICYF